MAKTLTVTDAPEASEELTPDEQDSLQVGQQLAQEQQELLAGKYKNAQDLEQAYIELQKKLGDGETKSEAEETTEEETTEEETEETVDDNPALALINEASAEFYKNDNKLSPETIEKFSELDSKQLLSAYLESVKNSPEVQQQNEVELAQKDIDRITQSVGGESEYKKVTEWAAKNLNESEISSFDTVIASGDPNVIELTVAGLKAKYDNSNGYEGRMLTGKTTSTADVFKSQAQLVAAISDPRYDRDPAYRSDVAAKLERSNLQF